MSTLTVGIITLVAVAFVFWYLNQKQEDDTKVDSEENKSVAETAPYKVPEPVVTTPTPSVVEAAPVVEAVAEAQPTPAITAPKSARTRKSTATASKPKVAAKKVATEKPTQTPPARKKAKLKTAK